MKIKLLNDCPNKLKGFKIDDTIYLNSKLSFHKKVITFLSIELGLNNTKFYIKGENHD